MLSLIILLFLIILNGIFAMSEIALISTSKGALREDAENGDQNAKIALELRENSSRFLSTIQVGITLVGVTSGAFGGQTIARDIADAIRENMIFLAPIADELGTATIVGITTYLTLVIGELVPKRIAMSDPEGMSKSIARPMNWLATVASPIVWVLSSSTEFVSRIIGVSDVAEDSYSDYEVISMVRQGINAGEFEEEEHRMVKGALELDDKLVREILTPRTEIIWLDINESAESMSKKLSSTKFSAYPICEDELDNVIGIISSKDLLAQLLVTDEINLRDLLQEPLFIPETVRASELLKQFRERKINTSIVVDEYGGIEGLATLTDLVQEVFGDVDSVEPRAQQREDGSWLVDAQLSAAYLDGMLPDINLPESESSNYQTLAGFVMARLSRVPKEGDRFEWSGYDFEVLDMDGKRIDKILIQPHKSARDIIPPREVEIQDNEGLKQQLSPEADDDESDA